MKGGSWIFIPLWVKHCFVTKSVRFGRTELSICRTCRESRDLEFEHGFRACFKKIKGKNRILILLGVKPCFVTKSVRFGRTELSICRICAESRDLQSEHGFEACSLKHKGKRLDFHTFQGQTSEKKTKPFDEFGQMLVF